MGSNSKSQQLQKIKDVWTEHRIVLIIFKQRGVPVKASRILMRIKSQESPALRTSGSERWRMFSWVRLEKCQHSWLDSEPFIRFRFITDLSHILYVIIIFEYST